MAGRGWIQELGGIGGRRGRHEQEGTRDEFRSAHRLPPPLGQDPSTLVVPVVPLLDRPYGEVIRVVGIPVSSRPKVPFSDLEGLGAPVPPRLNWEPPGPRWTRFNRPLPSLGPRARQGRRTSQGTTVGSTPPQTPTPP